MGGVALGIAESVDAVALATAVTELTALQEKGLMDS